MFIQICLLGISMMFSLCAQDTMQVQEVLHLLRAERYGDVQPYVREQLLKRAQELGGTLSFQKNSLTYYGTLLIKKIPVIYWQCLLLCFWYLIFWYIARRKRHIRLCVILLFGLLLITSIPIMLGYYIDKPEILVVAESAHMYNGPNSSFYKIAELKRYTVARLLDTKKEWYKIAYGSKTGWIARQEVEKI